MINQLVGLSTARLSPSQYFLTLYFVVAAGLALLAGIIRACTTDGKVGSRYRTATVARLCVASVAPASRRSRLRLLGRACVVPRDPDCPPHHLHSTGAGFDPDGSAVLVSELHQTDWSITVLLLTAQLLSVCWSVGTAARQTRMIAIGSAFLMIFTGFLGAFGFGGPLNIVMMLLWGAISGLFWAITTVVLIRAVVHSLLRLTSESAVLLRRAKILLLFRMNGLSGGVPDPGPHRRWRLGNRGATHSLRHGCGDHDRLRWPRARVAKLRTARRCWSRTTHTRSRPGPPPSNSRTPD